MSTPAPSVRSYSGVNARRSSRLERTVPLVILGTDRLGQLVREETSAVSLNLHGCRYPSRHEYAIASWITVQVKGPEGWVQAPVVRARVCSVFSPQTRRELCQVGVEFETPGNVWGLDAPPEDWQRLLGVVSATTPSAAAPAREPAEISSPLPQARPASLEWRSEVTMFPSPTSDSGISDWESHTAPGKAAQVVTTSDELLTALQGELQQAADKAIENAITTHLDEAVGKALERIEEAWRSNARQAEQSSVARIAELQSHAEELAQRLELLMGNARSNFSEMQKFVEHATRELEPQLRARLNESFDRASKELNHVAAQVAAQQFGNFTQGTQAALQEALLRLDARVEAVRPLIEDARNVPSAAHLETLLHSTKEETLGQVEARLQEMRGHWEEQQELQRNRLEEIVQKLEKQAGSPVPDAGKLAERAVREVEPQVRAILEESVGRAAQDFENAAARVADRQLVRLMDEKQRVAREASLEIAAGAAEARAHLQKAANDTLDELQRHAGVQIDQVTSEATQRITSSLASLDAENRAACEARRRALEGEVARAAEQSMQEFRTGIKAFLYSCLVAAVNAVDEHAQTTLDGLGKNAVILPHELMPSSEPSKKGEKGSSSDGNSH